MTRVNQHHRPYTAPEPTSVVGTVVVAVAAYEVAAFTVNEWVGANVVPSLMPRIQATTPRSIARAVTPQWSRYAVWIAVGTVGTVVAGAARGARPARLRR